MKEEFISMSIFGKIFGGGKDETYEGYDDDFFDDDEEFEEKDENKENRKIEKKTQAKELLINLIDNGDELVAEAQIPGIEPDLIDINITREILSIETKEKEEKSVEEESYIYKELSFGSSSRSIMLPAEIEVEESSAKIKDGMLVITMPKINKKKERKLSVRKN